MSNLFEHSNKVDKIRKELDIAFLEMLNEVFVTFPLVETMDFIFLGYGKEGYQGMEFSGFNGMDFRYQMHKYSSNLLELDLKESDIYFLIKLNLYNKYFYDYTHPLVKDTIIVKIKQEQVLDLMNKVKS